MLGDLRKFLALKVYQYELTFGLYMLNTWEKAAINSVVLVFLALGMYASIFLLPGQVKHALKQVVYYLSSEDLEPRTDV